MTTNVKEQDTFVRANTSSASPPAWGTASNGDSWTFNTGGASYTGQISSNQGTLTGGSALVSMTLGSTTLTNTDVLCRVNESTTGSAIGVTCRGTTSYYYAQLASPNLELGKRTGGVNTTLNTAAKTINASTEYWIRFRVINNSAGTSCNLYARMWQDGSSEPTSWDVTVTSDTSILTAGVVGLKAKMSGAGAIGLFDSFTATDASVIDAISMRVLVRTQVSKSLGLRTKVRTQNTKSVPLRVRTTIRATLSATLRALVSTKATVSIAMRTKIITQRTATMALRVSVSSNKKTLSLPLRIKAKTLRSVTIGLRVHAVTYVPEIAQITTVARDGAMSAKARDGQGMSTPARDGKNIGTKSRDGEISTSVRDGKDINAHART